jgi:hypothetical protein
MFVYQRVFCVTVPRVDGKYLQLWLEAWRGGGHLLPTLQLWSCRLQQLSVTGNLAPTETWAFGAWMQEVRQRVNICKYMLIYYANICNVMLGMACMYVYMYAHMHTLHVLHVCMSLCYAVLCCILFCSVLFYYILCFIMLCCAMLCHVILCYVWCCYTFVGGHYQPCNAIPII